LCSGLHNYQMIGFSFPADTIRDPYYNTVWVCTECGATTYDVLSLN